MRSSRHLAAIVFTDMVGFTASAQSDEAGALNRLTELDEIAGPLALDYCGRVIKSTGDGSLVEFSSALQAAEYAVELQRRLLERNLKLDGPPLEMRIGIHVGDVEGRGDDIFGDAVNIASRVVPLAEPGGVCLTGEVAAQVRHKVPFPLESIGSAKLKGVRDAVALYRVAPPKDGGAGESRSRPVMPRVAVLPFTNISPDPSDAYFADGLTEELITVLSRIRGLRVIARTSVSPYRSTEKSVSQIGRELGVTHVLEGSVRKAGDRLRITVQLIEAASQEHSWAETYDRRFDDVFAIQSDVAERTSEALRLELVQLGNEVSRKPPTHDLSAYASYLQAIHLWHEGREGGTQPVVDRFEEAIRKDPTFSLAYAQLANVLLQDLGDTRPGSEVFPRAKDLVTRALTLDPNSAEAHAARGNFAMQGELDWTLAESEFQKAVQLNPSSGESHAWYGLLLEVLGRFHEAIPHYQLGTELDPGQSIYRWRMAVTYCRMKRYGSAVDVLTSAVAARPDFVQLRINLANVFVFAGRLDDAEAELAVATELVRGEPDSAAQSLDLPAVRSRVAAARGDLGPTRARLAALSETARSRYVPLVVRARLHARLGECDEAVKLLKEDLERGDHALWFVYQDPDMEPLWPDRRFADLLQTMNLPVPS